MDSNEGRIPLGLFKQAYMKIESALMDFHEIKEDEDIDGDEKKIIDDMIECTEVMMAHIINIVSKEMGEEEFLNEHVPIDEIDQFPSSESDDILEQHVSQ